MESPSSLSLITVHVTRECDRNMSKSKEVVLLLSGKNFIFVNIQEIQEKTFIEINILCFFPINSAETPLRALGGCY